MTLDGDQREPRSSPPDRDRQLTNDAAARADAIASGRRSHKKSRSISQRHGLTRLKAALRGLGGLVVDRRTILGKALTDWREKLISDLGGTDAISTREGALVDLAVRTKLLLEIVDAWLLTQPSLVNKRTRALLPVVRERQQLADGLSRHLQALELERRAKPVLWKKTVPVSTDSMEISTDFMEMIKEGIIAGKIKFTRPGVE